MTHTSEAAAARDIAGLAVCTQGKETSLSSSDPQQPATLEHERIHIRMRRRLLDRASEGDAGGGAGTYGHPSMDESTIQVDADQDSKVETAAEDFLQRGHLDKPPASCPTVSLDEFYQRTDFNTFDSSEGKDRPMLSGKLGLFFRWLQLLGLYPVNDHPVSTTYTYIALMSLIAAATVTTILSLNYYGKTCGLGSVISSFRVIASFGSMCASYVFGFWYLRSEHFSEQLRNLLDRDIVELNKVINFNFWLLVVVLSSTLAFLFLSIALGGVDSPLFANPWSAAAQIIGIVFGASGFVAVANIFGIVCMIMRIYIWRFRIYAINTVIAGARTLSSILREEEAVEEKGDGDEARARMRSRTRTNSAGLRSPGPAGGGSGATIGLPSDVSILLAVQNRLHMLILLRYRRLSTRILEMKKKWAIWLSGVMAVSVIFFVVVLFSLYQWTGAPRKYDDPEVYTIGLWLLFSIGMPGYLLYHVARVNGDDAMIHTIMSCFSLDLEQTFAHIGAPEVPWLTFNDRVSFLHLFTGEFRRNLKNDMENMCSRLGVLGFTISMESLRGIVWVAFLMLLPLGIQLFFGIDNKHCTAP